MGCRVHIYKFKFKIKLYFTVCPSGFQYNFAFKLCVA